MRRVTSRVGVPGGCACPAGTLALSHDVMHGNVTTKPAGVWRPVLPVALPALAAAIYGWAVFASTFNHPGSIGFDYTAPGSDWMAIYGAVHLAVRGHFALAADSGSFTSYLNASFAPWLPRPLFYRPWVYPPSFVVILLPLGLLGLMTSYVAFQCASAALLAAALLHRAEQPAKAKWIALAALACPAASINAVEGQTCFLIAGLLVLGFRLMPERKLVAGLVLGIVSVKPHFGLLLPIALLAMRQWRVMFGAALSCVGLIVVSAAALGAQSWQRWLQSTAFYSSTSSDWSRFGRVWDSSVYTCATLLHAPPLLGSVLQLVCLLGAAAVVYAAFRRPLRRDLKLAVLLAAATLAAPHLGPYDMLLLTVAGALWFAELAAPGAKERSVLLLLWLAPLLSPPLLVPAGRLEPLLVMYFLWTATRAPSDAPLRLLQAGTPAISHPG